jgi:rod shape-determining protein MreC
MEKSRDDFVIAIRSAFLKKGTKQRFSILGLISFSIIFLVLGSFNYKPIDQVKKIIKEIVYRSSFIVSVPENFIESSYTNVVDHFTHYDSHLLMKSELEELRLKNLSSQIRIFENIKYKKLIDTYFIKETETFAKVLIDKQSPFLRSIIINKGSKNKIKLGMIALDDGYLVGKVVEVNYLSSRVLLISDINSKIPVSLQPGDIQAIMSGKGDSQGIIQYTRGLDLKKNNKDLKVITSGAGDVFISGINIGTIKENKNILENELKIVDFYKDFSQLKYVKVVSYTKEQESIDGLSKDSGKKIDDKIDETYQQQESLRILLEQKKIADQIRAKIEEENKNLRDNIIKLQNSLSASKNEIIQQEIEKSEIDFLKLNLIYGHKCRKSFLNSRLYKVGSPEYRTCIFNKAKKINVRN